MLTVTSDHPPTIYTRRHHEHEFLKNYAMHTFPWLYKEKPNYLLSKTPYRPHHFFSCYIIIKKQKQFYSQWSSCVRYCLQIFTPSIPCVTACTHILLNLSAPHPVNTNHTSPSGSFIPHSPLFLPKPPSPLPRIAVLLLLPAAAEAYSHCSNSAAICRGYK